MKKYNIVAIFGEDVGQIGKKGLKCNLLMQELRE
jgi:hypothetical protein